MRETEKKRRKKGAQLGNTNARRRPEGVPDPVMVSFRAEVDELSYWKDKALQSPHNTFVGWLRERLNG